MKRGRSIQKHWAYEAPVRPEIPEGTHPIDFLVGARLRELGLKPSAEADRYILARRLHWDLVGLPPTLEEVTAFEKDSSKNAYDHLVQRLLASPHYGDRMARRGPVRRYHRLPFRHPP